MWFKNRRAKWRKKERNFDVALKGAGCFATAAAHHQFSGFLHGHGQPFDHAANSLYAPPGCYGYASPTYGGACCGPWDSPKIHAPLGSKGFPWSFGAVSPLSSVMPPPPPPPPPPTMRQHFSSYQTSTGSVCVTGTGGPAAGVTGSGGFMAGIPLERPPIACSPSTIVPAGSTTPLAAAAAYLYGSGAAAGGRGATGGADDGEGDYNSIASLRLRARQHAVSASAVLDGGSAGAYPGSPRDLNCGPQPTGATGGLQSASSCQFTLPATSCGGVAVL